MAFREPTTSRRSAVAGGRMRIGLAIGAALLAIAAIVAATRGSSPPRLPLPGIGRPARAGDPFAYSSSRETSFLERAIAGSGHVLFTKSPGGIMATAARVARWRGLIDQATAGTGIDPNVVEGMVFVESAGLPDVIAGTDPAAASGLTQILAATGQSLLGMHVDLARSRKLTAEMATAAVAGPRDAPDRARATAGEDRRPLQSPPGRWPARSGTCAWPSSASGASISPSSRTTWASGTCSRS